MIKSNLVINEKDQKKGGGGRKRLLEALEIKSLQYIQIALPDTND